VAKLTVNRFEELVAWQKARLLAGEIYSATQTGRFARDFGLSSQIQRAASSIMFNIAEGFERGSRGEFHQFLSIAKGSCAEVRSQLYLALDIGYISDEQFRLFQDHANEVARLVSGLRSAVQKQRDAQHAKVSMND
jgi:four helix bundle protein